MTKEYFIGIVPYDLRRIKDLGNILLTKLDSNFAIEQSNKKIKDLTEFDHIVVYPASAIWFQNYRKLKCKVSLIIAEPKAIHKKYYNNLWLLRFKFHRIFVRYAQLANQYNNVIITPIAQCWIPKLSAQDFLKKDKLISIIASNKKDLTGHQLRHQIIKQIPNKNIAVLGYGYAPFKDKKEGLLPYYFSIVIENCQETDYFTEKILDAFACKTVPIYWGCPNIGDYFDVGGIIVFNTIEQLQSILNNLTVDDYQKYTKVMGENLKKARQLSNTKKIIADKLTQLTSQ